MADKFLFAGDSLIEYFNWQLRFPEKKVWNFGRAGETVEGLLARISDITDMVRPDWILIMTGTNNVGMEDFGFIPTYAAIVDSFTKAFPDAEIVANSLLPFTLEWIAPSTIPRMNEKIAVLAKNRGIRYLDAYRSFITVEKQPVADYFLTDGVHLSEEGYGVWADAISGII